MGTTSSRCFVESPGGISPPGCRLARASGHREAEGLLVRQKRLAKTAPVPCVVRDASSVILAEDDSLAENVQRAPLLGSVLELSC